jgi:hypothetical protein
MSVRRLEAIGRVVALGGLLTVPTYLLIAADRIDWTTRGPGGGGNIFSIGISPANPNIVLAGSDVGGMFRSANGGQTWQMVNNVLVVPARHGAYTIGVYPWEYSPFVFDPMTASTVYLGTLKSTDAGLTWTEKVPAPYLAASIFAVDPANSQKVYAVGSGYVYRSDCAFESCTPQPFCIKLDGQGCDTSVQVRSLKIRTAQGSSLLACTNRGLYRSTDDGSSWQAIPIAPVPPPNSLQSPVNPITGEVICNDLAYHAGSNRLYMSVGLTPDQTGCDPASAECVWPDEKGWKTVDRWHGGVYQSTDFGTTWTRVSGGLGAEVLPNTGFDTPGDSTHPVAGWDYFFAPPNESVVQESGVVQHGGSPGNVLKMSTALSTGSVGIATTVSMTSNQLYRISAWAKISGYTGGGCPNPPSDLFRASLFYYKDLAATQTAEWPGYPGDGWSHAWGTPLPSGNGEFSGEAASNNGWRYYETVVRPSEGTVKGAVYFFVDPNGGCGTGVTYLDDVSVVPYNDLPKNGYRTQSSYFLEYGRLAVDDTNPDTLYVGTFQAGLNDFSMADTGGVYRLTYASSVWSVDLITRSTWHDNVLDGINTAPRCGNGRCEGRREDCHTCPQDCRTLAVPTGACCGDGNPQDNGDDGECHNKVVGSATSRCVVDCPAFPDPRRPYFETPEGSPRYAIVQAMAIGSGAAGHETLFIGAPEHYKTTNAAHPTSDVQWTEMTSEFIDFGNSAPFAAWKARGGTNDVNGLAIATAKNGSTERLYYGDGDNRINLSTDGGQSFLLGGEPDWGQLGIVGDAASSILVDDADPNTIWVGISTAPVGAETQSDAGGTAVGSYEPAATSRPWTWTPLGDQSTFPKGGGVDLARLGSDFYAAVFGHGVYKLTGGSGAWTLWSSGIDASMSPPVPSCGTENLHTTRIASEPRSQHLFVSLGNPSPFGSVPELCKTGIWESIGGANNWTDITPSIMGHEPLTSILPAGPNRLFVSTYRYDGLSVPSTGGGLYKRKPLAGGGWTWGSLAVLAQPLVRGIAVSPIDNSLVYAFAGQVSGANDTPGQMAGIYKSVDGGGTFTLLPNYGLMHLFASDLAFSKLDPTGHTLLATTFGGGVFQGAITCTDEVRDFECATRINADALPVIPSGSTGTVVSTDAKDDDAGSPDGTYVDLVEAGSPKKLTAVWTLPGALAGVDYELRVEAAIANLASHDNFNFSVATTSASSCNGSESYGPGVLTVSKTFDDDVIQRVALGKLPACGSKFCVKVKDTEASDSTADTLQVDRLFLLPGPAPPADVNASSQGTPNPGTIQQGTIADTQSSNNVYEVLKEGVVTGKSKLIHTWTFTNVPSGAFHQLHVEGNRSANNEGDDFQFYYSTDGSNFALIPGALIGSTADVACGSDWVFGTGSISGTVYIQVRDTNQNSGSQKDTVSMDHLAIKTIPDAI